MRPAAFSAQSLRFSPRLPPLRLLPPRHPAAPGQALPRRMDATFLSNLPPLLPVTRPTKTCCQAEPPGLPRLHTRQASKGEGRTRPGGRDSGHPREPPTHLIPGRGGETGDDASCV